MLLEKKETNSQAPMPLIQAEIDSRMIFLSGGVDQDSAYKVTRSLLLLDELSHEPIKLFINSPGGEVNSGFSIFDCIRFLQSEVCIIGSGLVASAAALIYVAVPKTRRISFPHARYLLHQPLSGMKGVVTDLEIYAKEIDNLKGLINNILSGATERVISDIERDTDRDFWLTAQESQDYGLVGTIVQNKKDVDSLFSKKNTSVKETTTKKRSVSKSASTKVKKT